MMRQGGYDLPCRERLRLLLAVAGCGPRCLKHTVAAGVLTLRVTSCNKEVDASSCLSPQQQQQQQR